MPTKGLKKLMEEGAKAYKKQKAKEKARKKAGDALKKPTPRPRKKVRTYEA
jgi:hypothetical protein